MLSTRELATLIWLVPVATIVLWKMPSVRASLRHLVRIILGPVLVVPMAMFAAWMVAVVWVAAQVAAWDVSLLKDTLYWVLPGFVLMFGATRAATEHGFFRRRVRDAIGVSVFLAFYLGLVTLDLLGELLLVPVLALLSLYAAAGGTSSVSAEAGNRAKVALGVIATGLLVFTTIRFVQNPAATDSGSLARSFAMPIWLTLGALPFVWAMSVLFVYENALMHMRTSTPEGRLPWKSGLALVVSFRFRRTALHRFAGRWPRELVLAKGFRAARAIIARQQAEVRAEAARTEQAAEDLKRYAGVQGLDTRGRQLDKREFKETVDALKTLANTQVGWYRSSGNRYRGDLLDRFTDVYARGLPADHGITMAVSRSGQSWFAWRRTASGLCFAIGAAGPPPDQRFYEGMEPPSGFPKVTPHWTLPPHEREPNWEWVDDPHDSIYEEDRNDDGA